jgi:hypothetical protein
LCDLRMHWSRLVGRRKCIDLDLVPPIDQSGDLTEDEGLGYDWERVENDGDAHSINRRRDRCRTCLFQLGSCLEDRRSRVVHCPVRIWLLTGDVRAVRHSDRATNVWSG